MLDEDSRQQIPAELKDNLILTIYESKGLEFDDVLLYNFFKSSKCGLGWRVVTGYLNALIELQKTNNEEQAGATKRKHLQSGGPLKLQRDDEAPLVNLDLLASTRPRAIEFDAQKHKLLASELKQLYTAVTRARDRVWIFDESDELRAPLFEYLRALNLVTLVKDTQNRDELQEFLQTYSSATKESTTYEWRQRAEEFYQRQLFKLASQCYDKAHDSNMKEICLTHQQLQELNKNRANMPPKRFQEQILEIIARYLELGNLPPAIKCLQSVRYFGLIGSIFEHLKMVCNFCYFLLCH